MLCAKGREFEIGKVTTIHVNLWLNICVRKVAQFRIYTVILTMNG